MIIAIGTDIIEIVRIEKACKKNIRFIEKIFTNSEREYFDTRKNPIGSIAVNFAAKEAISKMLGTGFRGFTWQDIEILHDDLGKPYVVLHNRAKILADDLNIDRVMLSLSHSREIAVAYCVGVKEI